MVIVTPLYSKINPIFTKLLCFSTAGEWGWRANIIKELNV
jgi:hypothetical protein